MQKRILIAVVIATLPWLLAADWLGFRGPNNQGVAQSPALPTQWKVGADGANVAWERKLPGRGVSSPIVVSGRVIATSASGASQDRLHVHAFDAASGNSLWERQFWATGRTLCHPTSSVAACSPMSDGQRIFAFFSSNDLVCLDLNGNLLWYRGLTLDYPTAANDVGMSSSPLVVDGTVIVQVENKGDSFAAGLDAETGQTRWKIPRKPEMNWTSPTVWQVGSSKAVLLQSTDRLSAHEPATGRQLWSYDKTCKGIPSVVGVGGIAFIPSDGITAIRPNNDGRSPEVLWSNNKLDPGTPSPVVHDGRIYVINGGGALTCAKASDGEVLWRLRLKGSFWATPLIVGNHMYVVNRDGVAQVIELGEQGTIVSENAFGDGVAATPAVADGALYVRSDTRLWKIAAR